MGLPVAAAAHGSKHNNRPCYGWAYLWLLLHMDPSTIIVLVMRWAYLLLLLLHLMLAWHCERRVAVRHGLVSADSGTGRSMRAGRPLVMRTAAITAAHATEVRVQVMHLASSIRCPAAASHRLWCHWRGGLVVGVAAVCVAMRAARRLRCHGRHALGAWHAQRTRR